MKLRCLLLATLSICIATGTKAQTARLYDSGSGLPNTQINDLFQDSSGLLWVATNNGLYRFDGINFMDFHHDESNPNSIGSDLVMKVYEDSKGVIWICWFFMFVWTFLSSLTFSFHPEGAKVRSIPFVVGVVWASLSSMSLVHVAFPNMPTGHVPSELEISVSILCV